ncbi:Bcebp4 [Penicillium atrosanguineum]|uniref:Uncharacterized protein n=1 Tax=Penicillium atrosanguineum TaxID=1132637 RepID=A0A9W9Q413_9EURO|nr:Bcebp4 [Penicillium atrosanguineum]KAJ5133991.1 hypothetical protein N7526_005356 [Penicillium atrosanguineum]KAJ5304725.1 Bcebp4 [Penicillium atrosanguineum]KAJ5324190.1 hypothetical protein N7476_002790 [Penicillium atrosanguineum]
MQSAQSSPMKNPHRRRPTTQAARAPDAELIELTNDAPASAKKPQDQGSSNERRARRWRDHPPQSYLERLERIRQTKMIVIEHSVGGTHECPEISFDVVGSTGNIYEVVIRKEPVCNCPDGLKGSQCKHICYMLFHALKAPSHLQYQLAFLPSELREMFEESPLSRVDATSTEGTDGKRKPLEGDCPICFMEFEPNEQTVWCKAACGNNIHKKCFEQWAAASRENGVRCVYCRTPWEYAGEQIDIKSLRASSDCMHEGYVNVADQFGLSRERDFSVYSPFSTARWSSYSSRRGASERYHDDDGSL